MKKIYFIVNPKAGKTKPNSDMYNVLSEFCGNGYETTVGFTAYKGHASDLAETAAKKGYDIIACYGGDGTLNEVATGIIRSGTDVPIGYIPAGSTNDFAESIGIPKTALAAARNIVNGVPVTLDIGAFEDSHFTYIASFGAFSSVSYSTPQNIKNSLGHFAYVLQGLKDIGSIIPYKVKISAGNQVFSGEYIFGGIGNSKSFGGIVKLKDELVSLNDGEFEVVLVKPPKTPVDFNNIVMGTSFSDFSNPIFEFFKAKELIVESDGDFDWSLDGEFHEGRKAVHIKNLHSAIKILKAGGKNE